MIDQVRAPLFINTDHILPAAGVFLDDFKNYEEEHFSISSEIYFYLSGSIYLQYCRYTLKCLSKSACQKTWITFKLPQSDIFQRHHVGLWGDTVSWQSSLIVSQFSLGYKISIFIFSWRIWTIVVQSAVFFSCLRKYILYKKMALPYVLSKSYINAAQSNLRISLLNLIAENGGSIAEQCLIPKGTQCLRWWSRAAIGLLWSSTYWGAFESDSLEWRLFCQGSHLQNTTLLRTPLEALHSGGQTRTLFAKSDRDSLSYEI